MLNSLICRVVGHKVDRRRVWNDSVDFRTTCTRCRDPLLRGEAVWRRYDPARDDSAMRDVHPRERG